MDQFRASIYSSVTAEEFAPKPSVSKEELPKHDGERVALISTHESAEELVQAMPAPVPMTPPMSPSLAKKREQIKEEMSGEKGRRFSEMGRMMASADTEATDWVGKLGHAANLMVRLQRQIQAEQEKIAMAAMDAEMAEMGMDGVDGGDDGANSRASMQQARQQKQLLAEKERQKHLMKQLKEAKAQLEEEKEKVRNLEQQLKLSQDWGELIQGKLIRLHEWHSERSEQIFMRNKITEWRGEAVAEAKFKLREEAERAKLLMERRHKVAEQRGYNRIRWLSSIETRGLIRAFLHEMQEEVREKAHQTEIRALHKQREEEVASIKEEMRNANKYLYEAQEQRDKALADIAELKTSYREADAKIGALEVERDTAVATQKRQE